MTLPKEFVAEKFSKPYEEPRFRIVNKETGEVVDDAQGYGYKTIAKAYRAISYKLNKKERAQTAIQISNFKKENETVLNELKKEIRNCCESVEDIMFYAMKDHEKVSEKKALEEAFSSFWKAFEQKGGTIPEDKSFRFRIEQNFLKKKDKNE